MYIYHIYDNDIHYTFTLLTKSTSIISFKYAAYYALCNAQYGNNVCSVQHHNLFITLTVY